MHGKVSARSVTAIRSNVTRFEADTVTAESITMSKAVITLLNVTLDASLKRKIFSIDTLYSRRQIEARDLSTSKLTVNVQASFQGKADVADVNVRERSENGCSRFGRCQNQMLQMRGDCMPLKLYQSQQHPMT